MLTHLHTHSEYSMLDGLARIDKLVAHAKSEGYTSLGLTDHGSTSGLFSFWKECIKQDIHPVLGTEFYWEFEDDEKRNGHLIVFAKDNEGLSNLFQLQKYAYTKNFYKKPRINFKALQAHSKGLIVTSACIASEINSNVLEGNLELAKRHINEMHNLFGEDFYLEIQPNSIEEVIKCNTLIAQVSMELNIPLVIGGDIHYLKQEDSFSHEVLLACQSKKKMSDPKRFRFTCEEFYMKSEAEVRESLSYISDELVTQAINNTSIIANKCNASFSKDRRFTKYWNVPEGMTSRELLCKEAVKGIHLRGKAKNKQYIKDVQNEIDVLDRNGYTDYMLVVSDYIQTAKDNGIIVGDGRGSGSGSKLAYVLRMHEVDPEAHHLLFERFMADGREADFDTDFSDQDAVFKDLQSKYGEDSVARIAAFGTMTPKATFRKVASAFGMESYEINRISKDIDEKAETIQEAIDSSKLLKDYFKANPHIKKVCIDMEGIVSHESVHAGGVVIYPDIAKHLPVKSNSEDRGKMIVAFDKYMVEELGMQKYDVLGLETLPIVKRCLDSIDKDIDLLAIDYDDTNVYEMLCTGDVSGIFQLANQKDKVVQQQPRNFKDLIAINALIRPMEEGVWEEYLERRAGKEWSTHKDRMSYMEDTMGIITYQEQYMLDAGVFAGWHLADADKLLRKKRVLVDDVEYRQKFINDSLARGYAKEDVEQVLEEVIRATKSSYSFNKSHAASYAILSFKTAWLKHYYPLEFYASMMSSEDTGTNGSVMINKYINELKQRGLSILPPSINTSDDTFRVESGAIRYKLTGIKTVGETAYNHIKSLRPIKSFEDLMERRQRDKLKNNVIVNLIKAGIFDEFGEDRLTLMKEFEDFDYDKKVIPLWEKESLGIYITEHPMSKYGYKDFDDVKNNEEVWQGGEVVEATEAKDRAGKMMCFVTLETLHGSIKVLVFSKTYATEGIRELLFKGNLIKIYGKKSGDAFLANQIKPLERR